MEKGGGGIGRWMDEEKTRSRECACGGQGTPQALAMAGLPAGLDFCRTIPFHAAKSAFDPPPLLRKLNNPFAE
jgi:hypothetical protein